MWSGGDWRPFGDTVATLTNVEITDCPNPDVTRGWEVNKSDVTRDAGVVQYTIPLVIGEMYSLSCYARKTTSLSDSDDFRLRLGEAYHWKDKLVTLSSDWVRIENTFTVTGTTNRAVFQVEPTMTGIFQICGMKLEVGNKATGWSLSPWDMVSRADYNALADRVAILEAK